MATDFIRIDIDPAGIHQLIAEQPRLRRAPPRRRNGEASVSSGSISSAASLSQRVSARSMMRRLRGLAPPGSMMKPSSRIASSASRNARNVDGGRPALS